MRCSTVEGEICLKYFVLTPPEENARETRVTLCLLLKRLRDMAKNGRKIEGLFVVGFHRGKRNLKKRQNTLQLSSIAQTLAFGHGGSSGICLNVTVSVASFFGATTSETLDSVKDCESVAKLYVRFSLRTFLKGMARACPALHS